MDLASLKQLDVVALLRDRPELGLRRGSVGSLLLELSPGAWEVEFTDKDGRPKAIAALAADDLLLLQLEAALV